MAEKSGCSTTAIKYVRTAVAQGPTTQSIFMSAGPAMAREWSTSGCRSCQAGSRTQRSSECPVSASRCDRCHGSGRFIRKKCHLCSGTLTVESLETTVLFVERGMTDGSELVGPLMT